MTLIEEIPALKGKKIRRVIHELTAFRGRDDNPTSNPAHTPIHLASGLVFYLHAVSGIVHSFKIDEVRWFFADDPNDPCGYPTPARTS